jgi:putative ubiquitin-RnfH superfamily antitoxin RatB of RatAB toxin-antitoxin module
MLNVTVVYSPGATSPIEKYELTLPAGAVVQDAITMTGLLKRYLQLVDAPIGIFSKIVPPHYPLTSGDRIEIYRPLLINPKDARRARAKCG